MIDTPEERQRSSRWPFALRIAGTVLSLALVGYLIADQGWEEFTLAVDSIGWGALAISFLLMLASRLVVSGRWFSLLYAVDRSVSPVEATKLTFAGLFASNFLPTTIGGDLVRFAGGFQMKLDSATLATSLIMDRLVGMCGMSFMIPFVYPLVVGRLFIEQLIPELHNPPSIQLWALSIAIPAGWIQRVRGFFERILTTLRTWLHRPGYLGLALIFTFMHMGLLFLSIRVLMSGLGEPLALLRIGSLWSLVYFLTLIPVSINGLGLQEVSFTYIFSTFGGISVQHAVTVAVLIRTLFWLASLPGAIYLPSMLEHINLRRSPARRSSAGTEE